MNDKCFIDTNIFLYAFSTKDINKQNIAKKIVLQPSHISTQVINESCSNFIKKLTFDEDMQHKQIIENTLQIINPFKGE